MSKFAWYDETKDMRPMPMPRTALNLSQTSPDFYVSAVQVF